jgi:hypothetical protein
MIVERFKNGDAAAVYGRFRDRGRMLFEGLKFVGSWVFADLSRCYQVMECADRRLLEQWIACWHHLVEFEVIPVIQSAEAAQRVETTATPPEPADPAT